MNLISEIFIYIDELCSPLYVDSGDDSGNRISIWS